MSPHTANSISAYYTLYDDAANLRHSDFTTLRRFIAGFAGLIAFLLFIQHSQAKHRPSGRTLGPEASKIHHFRSG